MKRDFVQLKRIKTDEGFIFLYRSFYRGKVHVYLVPSGVLFDSSVCSLYEVSYSVWLSFYNSNL